MSNVTLTASKVYKDRDGRQTALDRFTVAAIAKPHKLDVETYRDSRGYLNSHVSLFWQTPDGRGWTHSFSFGGGGDYSETIAHGYCSRDTEAKVKEAQARAVAKVDEIAARVVAHYARASAEA